jgi:hypothetical protein
VDLVVPVAILDGCNLDIRCPDKNSELDGLQHVNFFCLVNAILKALQQETVEATTIIGLKIVDDASITGLLKQRGFLYFPMTQRGSLSKLSPLQQRAKVSRSLFCLRPSSCFVAKELLAWN